MTTETVDAKNEKAMLALIDDRDEAIEWADRLAYAIGTVEEIGEHSNMNDPYANALELLERRDGAVVGLLALARHMLADATQPSGLVTDATRAGWRQRLDYAWKVLGRPTARLTLEDIKGSFTTHYGYQVSPLGESCDALLIVGHLSPMRAAGVARHVARAEWGEELSEVSNVQQRHGVFRRPTVGDRDGWEFEVDWFVHCEDEPVEGSVPVTVLDIKV